MLNHSLWNSISFNANKNFIFHLSKLFLWKVADEKVANFSGFSFGYFTYIFPLHLILLGRITVHSVHSHLCSLHFFLTLPAFTSEGNFHFFPRFRKLLQRGSLFTAFFREIFTCHLHEFLRGYCQRKAIFGSRLLRKHDFGINWKNVRAAESLLLYFFWLELLIRDL